MTTRFNLRSLLTLAIIGASIILVCGNAVAFAQEQNSQIDRAVNQLTNDDSVIVGNTMLVKYKTAKTENQAQQDFSKGLTLFTQTPANDIKMVDDNTAFVALSSRDDLKSGLRRALARQDVEFAQPLYKYFKFADYEPTANPQYPNQWYLRNQASGINMPTAWGKIGDRLAINCASDARCGGLSTVKVAVIDSGVNLDGTEIASNSVDSANAARFFYNNDNSCAPGEFYATVNIGTTASPALLNFCRQTGVVNQDQDGHGSTVASAIMMENNSSQGIGVAYNTTLLPVALNGDYSYNSFIVSEAIIYATDKGAKVINLSMGTSVNDQILKQAIEYANSKNVTVVASSGNCGDKTAYGCGIGSNNTTINPKIYPAEYPEVLSIGAINYGTDLASITRSSYSSYSTTLDFVTGVGVPNAQSIPFGVHGLDETGTYTTTNIGTSFSAPVATGVAALGYSLDANMTAGKLKQFLIFSAKDLLTPGFDTQTGYGLIDAGAFVDAVISNQVKSAYDYNGDGLQDILFQSQSDGGAVYWSIQRNDTSFLTSSDIANPKNPAWRIQAVSDVDKNGFTDVILRNSNTMDLFIWFVENGKFKSGKGFSSVPSSEFVVVGMYDFNGDGIEDILFQSQATGQINVWYLNSSATIIGGGALANPNDGNWKVRGGENLSTPGKVDIVVQNAVTNKIVLWRFTNGVYSAGVVYDANIGSEWRVVDVTRMTSNQNPGIVFQSQITSQVNYWELGSNGSIVGGAVIANPNNPRWKYIRAVNYDEDGIGDILLQNSSDGTPYIWKVNSTGYYQGVGYPQLGAPGTNWRVI